MDITDLDIRLRDLSPAKRALLEQRLKQSGARVASSGLIPRRETRESAPLSFAQQRMWFLNQLEPGSSSYNEANAIRLLGALDVRALQTALNQLVARHEVLRTTINMVDDEPRQVVNPSMAVPLPIIDLQETAAADRAAEIKTILLQVIQRPFDLARDAPLRVLLVRLDEQEHILLKIIHHIASDGWSSGIVWRELEKYYRDATTGTDSAIAELPIQYQDYAAWQRTWLQGEILQTQLAYWKKNLAGVSPLALPTDRSRTPGKKSSSARAVLDVDEGVTASLRALSKQQGVTFFMTVLAAFQTLLHRYCGQDDIAVGSPIAGRTRPELENLIGFFVNTVVLRTDLSGDPTFQELLIRVRNVALEAYAHQDLPFEKLVEELNPVRDLDSTPLFQVLFAHQNVPRVPIEFAGLETAALEVSNGEAKFDLLVAVLDNHAGLRLRIEYATDLFDAASIERMFKNFLTLLGGIAADPNQRLSELPLLSEPERHRLLDAWNDTRRDYPNDKCVHHLFQAQVERTPDGLAVISDGQELTYKDLDGRANQLARHLHQSGVTAQTHVAICMERGIEMMVAVLGVLKTGAAYVPLDPEYPRERLEFMLRDAHATLILTQKRLVDDGQWRPVLNQVEGTEIRDPLSSILDPRLVFVCLDDDWSAIATQSAEPPDYAASSDQAAYVIYTSGSTGKPKGVVMEHRALGNLIAWQIEHSNCAPQARTLQFASLSFDVSFQEMFCTWCSGGTLVLLTGETRHDPAALLRYLAEKRVERIFLPFVALQQLADAAQVAESLPPRLCEIITAGEQLRITPQIRSLFDRLSDCRLVNQYGPSESHVVTAFVLEQSRQAWPALPPIGRPIQNALIYVLDSKLQPVPIGVAGELYIGGDGLARGYLNHSELTVEKFIDRSFDGEPSRRLYRTGDFARYRPDGNIEFLGRQDHQVKLRGYRIELGEIEAVLGQHSEVRESVVIVSNAPARESQNPKLVSSQAEGSAGGAANQVLKFDQRLIAYLVTHPTGLASASELRGFLKKKLPEYMIPSAWVFLDSLPLTPSGKVDRRALAHPDLSHVADQTGYVAPRTTTEKLLAAVWAEVIGVERVGRHDNFFDLGGHSMLVVGLFARIMKLSGRDLPLSMLFRAPTIEAFADFLDRESPGAWSSTVVPVRSGGSRPPFFCVHGVWGSVVFGAELARRLGSDQPFYGLQAAGLDGEQEPLTTIEDMAAHHVRELRRVQAVGPYFLGGLSMGGLVAFEIAQQLYAQSQTVALLALIDTYRPTRNSPIYRWSNRARRLLVDDIFGRAVFHCRNLWQLGAVQQSTYTREKARLFGKRIAAKLRLDHQGIQAHLGDIYAVKVRKANIEAMRKYNPRDYPGRITLLMTSDSRVKRRDSRKGWRELALGGLDIQVVPGDHSTMINESHVGTLAAKLGECLHNAQTPSIR